MPKNETGTGSILLDGASYLDSLVEEMERQAHEMLTHANATEINEVKEGYLKFAEVLTHCAVTLHAKSAELRAHQK